MNKDKKYKEIIKQLEYKTTGGVLLRLLGLIKRYFTEPFEDYDGNWKGFIYYEKMRIRKECIKFWGIMIFLIAVVILLSVFYTKLF